MAEFYRSSYRIYATVPACANSTCVIIVREIAFAIPWSTRRTSCFDTSITTTQFFSLLCLGLQVHDSLLINELIRSCGQFIHVLDLRANALQDTGMSHIASQLSQYDEQHRHESVLCKLSFQSNQLTQQGIAFLAKCLLHNRTLRSLDLSHNNLHNEGLFLLRDALLTNRTVNELILRDCRLTDQAAIALAEFIAESTTIQYIDLRYRRSWRMSTSRQLALLP